MVVVVGLTQAAAQLHRRTEYAQYIIYRKHLVCASSLDQSNAVAVCGGAQLHDYYTNDWQGHSRNIYNKQNDPNQICTSSSSQPFVIDIAEQSEKNIFYIIVLFRPHPLHFTHRHYHTD